MYSYKNKPEKIKNEKYNTDVVEPYIQEFIKDKLYLTWTNKPITVSARSSIHYFTIDDKLRYISFFADFGPLNIAQVVKFCELLNSKFKSEDLKNKKFVLVSGPDNDRRANSAFLMCAYMLLAYNLTPEEAYKPIADIAYTFEPYRDAGYGPATYFITIKHCLQGLYKAIKTGLLDIDNLDIEEYEYYEKVEHGDLNWITKKFIAFASPKERPTTHGMNPYENMGNTSNFLQQDINTTSQQWFRNSKDVKMGNKKILYPANTMDGIVKYFKDNGVTCVVRLNNKLYDNRKFLEAGISHYEFYFPDGTIPPDNILFRFFDLCETNPGSIAIHCKAGLGRTGTLIGAYLMKTYKFLAAEVIAFLRLMRPGCVVGPQQNYLQSIEQKLLRMKATPLPYQISLVKAPTSNIVKRVNMEQYYPIEFNQNEIFKSKIQNPSESQNSISTINKPINNTFNNNDIIMQTYENNRKKSLYTPSSSASSTLIQKNKSYNSTDFTKNGFSIPVQPRKNTEYQNNNNKNTNNENSDNLFLKQESNELRSLPYDNKQKVKSSKSHIYNNGGDDTIKNKSFINDRNLVNNRSTSLQQFSRPNNKNSLRDVSSHLKKTKSENQAFQKYFSSNALTINSLNTPSSSTSHSSKVKKSMFSSNNYSTPILPQTKPYNLSNTHSPNPFSSSSRQMSSFSSSTNSITSLSHVTATPNFLKKTAGNSNNGLHYISHSQGYLGSSNPSRQYYNNDNDMMDIDDNYQGTENRIKANYSNKTLHENVYSNLIRKKDGAYMDYIKTPKYSNKKIN